MNMNQVGTEKSLEMLNGCPRMRNRLRSNAVEEQVAEHVVDFRPVLILNVLLIFHVLLFGHGETVVDPVEDVVEVSHRMRQLTVRHVVADHRRFQSAIIIIIIFIIFLIKRLVKIILIKKIVLTLFPIDCYYYPILKYQLVISK